MIGVSGRTALPGQSPDGNPNLERVWQALNTASWDLRDHPASLGVPAGQGVVVGKEIPYQPWAAVQQKENFEKRATTDPETNCLLPGVPHTPSRRSTSETVRRVRDEGYVDARR